VLCTMFIGQIQIFDEPFLLWEGGPGDASRSISMLIFETAYKSQNYGYASAIALLLLFAILLLTVFQFKLQGIWVNYDNE